MLKQPFFLALRPPARPQQSPLSTGKGDSIGRDREHTGWVEKREMEAQSGQPAGAGSWLLAAAAHFRSTWYALPPRSPVSLDRLCSLLQDWTGLDWIFASFTRAVIVEYYPLIVFLDLCVRAWMLQRSIFCCRCCPVIRFCWELDSREMVGVDEWVWLVEQQPAGVDHVIYYILSFSSC